MGMLIYLRVMLQYMHDSFKRLSTIINSVVLGRTSEQNKCVGLLTLYWSWGAHSGSVRVFNNCNPEIKLCTIHRNVRKYVHTIPRSGGPHHGLLTSTRPKRCKQDAIMLTVGGGGWRGMDGRQSQCYVRLRLSQRDNIRIHLLGERRTATRLPEYFQSRSCGTGRDGRRRRQRGEKIARSICIRIRAHGPRLECVQKEH